MDRQLIAGAAGVLVAGAIVVGVAVGTEETPASARRTDIDSELAQPHSLATSEVMIPRGWRVVGAIEYQASAWRTVAVDHEERPDGTRILILSMNESDDARRVAAWIHYAGPAGE